MAAADDSEVTNRCHAAADLIWEGRHDELEASAAEGCERGDALSLLFVAEASFFRYALSGASAPQEEAAECLARVTSRVDELHSKTPIQWFSGQMAKAGQALHWTSSSETPAQKAARKRRKQVDKAIGAHADLLRGPLYLINGKYLKAGLAFRSSLLSFEALQAAGGDPHPVVASYRDWGIGIFQLFLANAPQSILSVLELVAGIKGDMVEARRKLQACVDGAGPAARWAAVVLAMDKVNSAACGFDPAVAMASLESARAVIDEQLRLLPGSALLKWMHAVVVLRMGDLPRALIAMDEVQAQVVPALASRGVPAYRLALEVGLIHFACRDLDTAIACWEPLADPTASYTARALSAVLLGTALSMKGQRERAVETWGRVQALAQGGQYDGSLTRKVSVFQRRSEPALAGIELMWIRGTMPMVGGKDPMRLQGMQGELQGMLERCTRRVAGGRTPASRPTSPFAHPGPHPGDPNGGGRGGSNGGGGSGGHHAGATHPGGFGAGSDVAEEGVPGGLPLGEMTAAERFEEELTVRLYLGIVKRIMGQTDDAFRLLEGVLRDSRSEDAKALNLPDPFHEACSLYELAVLQINQGGYHEAERLLKDLGSARSGFSFETVLQYRFKAARDYVQAQLRGERAGGHSGGAEPPANVDAGGGSGEVGPSPAEANATTEREAEAEAEAERGLVGKKAELAGDEQQHGTAAAAAAHADS